LKIILTDHEDKVLRKSCCRGTGWHLGPAVNATGLSPRAAVTRHLLCTAGTRADLGDRCSCRTRRCPGWPALLAAASSPRTSTRAASAGRAILPRCRRPHVVGCKLTGHAYGVVCDMFGEIGGAGRAPAPADGAVPAAAAVKAVAQVASRLGRRVPSLDGIGCRSAASSPTARSCGKGPSSAGATSTSGAAAQAHRPPVVVTNDVTALAREELWFGAGRTHSTFGLITIGAGLGFGVVREGVVVEELIDNGHLLAHAPVDSRAPAAASATRVRRRLPQPRRHRAPRVGRRTTTITFGDLVQARSAGDPTATALLDGAARALGHLAATFAGALQTTGSCSPAKMSRRSRPPPS
jgi:predicted NBD/HSP70 family sugar kinase